MAKQTITISKEDFDEAVLFFLLPDDECEALHADSLLILAMFGAALKGYLFDREVSAE